MKSAGWSPTSSSRTYPALASERIVGATFGPLEGTVDPPVGFDFTPTDRDHYYEVVWPELIAWLPRFERLEVVGSWAGLYEHNSLDANGIIGEWPSVAGIFQATGFSGHGFQQCHAVGRYISEKIQGLEPFLDLTRLGPEQIISSAPMPEHAGRII